MKIKHSIYLLSTTAVTFGCGYNQNLGARNSSDASTSNQPSSAQSEATAFSCRREEHTYVASGLTTAKPSFSHTVSHQQEVSYRDLSNLTIRKHQVCDCKKWDIELDYPKNHVIKLTKDVCPSREQPGILYTSVPVFPQPVPVSGEIPPYVDVHVSCQCKDKANSSKFRFHYNSKELENSKADVAQVTWKFLQKAFKNLHVVYVSHIPHPQVDETVQEYLCKFPKLLTLPFGDHESNGVEGNTPLY
ncbi:MAG: hypothetical protein K2X94_02810 [Amoebophilaceae bacterium]|nr:hypothetical protein [Amoebophilaceae bacterium]